MDYQTPKRDHAVWKVFRMTLRQNRPLLWGLMLLFFFALLVLDGLSSDVQSIVGSLFNPVASRVGYDSVLLLIGLICILLSLRLFSWQYQQRSAAYYDALPVGRAQAVLGRYAAFLCLILIPVTVNTGLLIVWKYPELLGCMERTEALFYGVYVPLTLPVLSLAICTFCTLCTQLSGTARGAASLMLLYTAAGPALVLCLKTLRQLMLPFLDLPVSEDTLLFFGVSPLSGGVFLHAWFYGCNEDLPLLLTCAAYWAVLSLLGVLLLSRLAKRRLSEGAQATVHYARFTFFSEALFALCVGLTCACMAGITASAWFWLLLVAVSFGAAVAARYLTHGKERLIHCGGCVFAFSMLLFCGIYAVFATGYCGYYRQIPARGEITAASYRADYQDRAGNPLYPYVDGVQNGRAAYLGDEAAISLIYQAHQNELERIQAGFPFSVPRNYEQEVHARFYSGPGAPRFLTVSYELKSGAVFTRRFVLEDGRLPDEVELALFSLESYDAAANALTRFRADFGARPERIQTEISIRDLGSMELPSKLWSAADTEQLLSLMDRDQKAALRSGSFALRRTNADNPWVFLSCRNADESDLYVYVSMPLPPDYTQTRRFLQAKGIWDWLQQRREDSADLLVRR